MSRASWSPEDRAEYATALEEAFLAGGTSTERIDAMEAVLADAVQAHRPWAVDIQREAIRAGLNRFITEHGKRRQPDIVLAYNGRVIAKPRRRGVVTRLESGEHVHQQALFEDMTQDEFRSLLKNRCEQIDSLADEMVMLRRIEELFQFWPDALTVAEALHLQGCSLDEWLEVEESA